MYSFVISILHLTLSLQSIKVRNSLSLHWSLLQNLTLQNFFPSWFSSFVGNFCLFSTSCLNFSKYWHLFYHDMKLCPLQGLVKHESNGHKETWNCIVINTFKPLSVHPSTFFELFHQTSTATVASTESLETFLQYNCESPLYSIQHKPENEMLAWLSDERGRLVTQQLLSISEEHTSCTTRFRCCRGTETRPSW